MRPKKSTLLLIILLLIKTNIFAWTSSNEGVGYTIDTLCILSDSINYNPIDELYEVQCDIVILENDSLILNAGEVIKFIVYFNPPQSSIYYGIIIYGTLKAIGTANMPIIIGDPESTMTNGEICNGIILNNTSPSGESIIKYCHLKRVINEDANSQGYNSAIYCNNSSPVVDNCRISYMNSGEETGGCSGIACDGQSFPIISNCTFEKMWRSVAIWCQPWKIYPDTINCPNPIIIDCNIMPSVQGFVWPLCSYDRVILNGGFLINCYLGISNLNIADTSLGNPIDTVGDGICNTISTCSTLQRFYNVDGVVSPRGDTLLTTINENDAKYFRCSNENLKLANCYPNPFNKFTTIKFELKANSYNTSIVIIDSNGNEVKSLISGAQLNAGKHQIKWYGENDYGQKVNEGIYFFRLMLENCILIQKISKIN